MIEEKDRVHNETKKVSEEYRLKLQESFKEYLCMDQSMVTASYHKVILRREAQKGSQAADSRNVMLQKSLEKLTNDFEVCAKDLATSQSTIKELEFELETLVRQFNLLGEAKKQLDESYTSTSTTLRLTETELEHLKKDHEQVLLLKSKFEADSRLHIIDFEDKIKDFEEKIATLSTNNVSLSLKRAELEAIVKSNKAEIDKQNANLKVIVSQKNALQTEIQTAASKAESEIVTRNLRINELTESRLADQKLLKNLQEAKEQLLFQLTSVKNNLDREVATVKQLNFEIAQSKRESEEKASMIEDQLDKLNSAKTNLTRDKAQLIEKLNNLRTDFKAKEQELLDTQNSFAAHRQQSATTIAQLQKTISELESSHSSLDGSHKELNRAHADLQVQHKAQCEKYENQCGTEMALKKDIRHLRADLLESRNEIEELKTSLAASVSLQGTTKAELDACSTESKDLAKTLDITRNNAFKLQKTLEAENTTLTFRLTKSMKENDAHAFTINRLQTKVAGLEKDLSTTNDAWEKETKLRELLQIQLHENRIKYGQESRMRGEFERLNMKLRQQQLLADVEEESTRNICQRKLNHVTHTMGTETNRLKEFSALLLPLIDSDNTALPTGREFEWLFGDTAFTRNPPKPEANINKSPKDKHGGNKHTSQESRHKGHLPPNSKNREILNALGSSHHDDIDKPRKMAPAVPTQVPRERQMSRTRLTPVLDVLME
jgi:chromosome segregation ATPase